MIAIIAILAGILLPIYVRAKATARQSVCLSNMKQMGLAHILYAGDNDDTFTLAFAPGPTGAMDYWSAAGGKKTLSWQNLLQPYMKAYALGVCSEFPPFSNSDVRSYPNPNWHDAYLSYGIPIQSGIVGRNVWTDCYYFNQNIDWQGIAGVFPGDGYTPNTMRPTPSLTTSQVDRSAEMTLVSEAAGPDEWMVQTMTPSIGACTWVVFVDGKPKYFPPSGYPAANIGLTVGPLPRHNRSNRDYVNFVGDDGALNSVYCDTHVRYDPFERYLRHETLSDGRVVYTTRWPYGK